MDYDLADSMTKKKGDSREGLLKFMGTWHWTIAYDPNFAAAKKKLGLTVDKIDRALRQADALCSMTSSEKMPEPPEPWMTAIAEDQSLNFFYPRATDPVMSLNMVDMETSPHIPMTGSLGSGAPFSSSRL